MACTSKILPVLKEWKGMHKHLLPFFSNIPNDLSDMQSIVLYAFVFYA